MALTLISAPSGHGVMLRDTHARREIYISDAELLEVGTALIRVATERQPLPKPRRKPKDDESRAEA